MRMPKLALFILFIIRLGSTIIAVLTDFCVAVHVGPKKELRRLTRLRDFHQ